MGDPDVSSSGPHEEQRPHTSECLGTSVSKIVVAPKPCTVNISFGYVMKTSKYNIFLVLFIYIARIVYLKYKVNILDQS